MQLWEVLFHHDRAYTCTNAFIVSTNAQGEKSLWANLRVAGYVNPTAECSIEVGYASSPGVTAALTDEDKAAIYKQWEGVNYDYVAYRSQFDPYAYLPILEGDE